MWIVIQARSTSTRLPRKCASIIQDKYLIKKVYDTCLEASDKVLVIIPQMDIYLIDLLKHEKIPYFEGNEFDLTTRYYEACLKYDMNIIARITGDCPFINPASITHSLHLMKKYKADFVSNCIGACVDGFEVDMFNAKALGWMHSNTKGAYREHVTEYFKKYSEYSGLKTYSWSEPYDPKLFPKMSIDTKNDLDNCQRMKIPQTKGML